MTGGAAAPKPLSWIERDLEREDHRSKRIGSRKGKS